MAKKIIFKKYLNVRNFLITSFIFSVYLYLTPFISILSFKIAIDNNNADAANKYIDYVSLRKGIKSQLSNRLQFKTDQRLSDDYFSYIKSRLLTPVINSMVDVTVESIVNPSGVKLLLEKGRIQSEKGEPTKSSKNKAKPKINLHYKSINQFHLVSNIDTLSKPVVATWKRNNLIHWRLSYILLPLEITKHKVNQY